MWGVVRVVGEVNEWMVKNMLGVWGVEGNGEGEGEKVMFEGENIVRKSDVLDGCV